MVAIQKCDFEKWAESTPPSELTIDRLIERFNKISRRQQGMNPFAISTPSD